MALAQAMATLLHNKVDKKKSWYPAVEQLSRWVEAKPHGLLLFAVWPTISVCRDLATALALALRPDCCNGDSQRLIVHWFPIEMQTKSKRRQQLTAVTSRKYPVEQQQAICGVYRIELKSCLICPRAADRLSSASVSCLVAFCHSLHNSYSEFSFGFYGILIAAHKSVSVALPFRLLFVQRAAWCALIQAAQLADCHSCHISSRDSTRDTAALLVEAKTNNLQRFQR